MLTSSASSALGSGKEILANILGLSHYDELERRAKELASDRGTEADKLENTINEIGLQLTTKPKYEDEIRKIQNEISQLEERKKLKRRLSPACTVRKCL